MWNVFDIYKTCLSCHLLPQLDCYWADFLAHAQCCIPFTVKFIQTQNQNRFLFWIKIYWKVDSQKQNLFCLRLLLKARCCLIVVICQETRTLCGSDQRSSADRRDGNLRHVAFNCLLYHEIALEKLSQQVVISSMKKPICLKQNVTLR